MMKAQKDFDIHAVLALDEDEILKSISIDFVVIGFHDKNLKVLLNRFKYFDTWILPGGFVLKDESIDDAAYRILKTRTGLDDDIFLKEFHTFGDYGRNTTKEVKKALRRYNIPESEIQRHWIHKRFISIAHYALVDYTKVEICNTEDDQSQWFDIDQIPSPLFADHNRILEVGLETIREQLNSIPIDCSLLPEIFTMSELRSIYETIMGAKLDRRNFQKSILQTGYVIQHRETKGKNSYKPTKLYSFDKEKYQKALDNDTLYRVTKPQIN